MTEFDKADRNGNGIIDPPEWQALELEDLKRRIEDDDAKRDSQRRMAWFALLGMLFYPLGVVLASVFGLDKAADIIGDMAGIYFVSIAALVGAYFGVTNLGQNKKP
jgi:hypothetical protein